MKDLNANTFEDAISISQPVAVDFWAAWCMPCRIFAPVLEEISDEFDGKAEFCKVNIDDCPELAQEYGIEVIPTVVVFKNGKPVDKTSGVLTKDQVKFIIEKHI
ncbi:MAG: thioredoxin [Oscillospiraceae bacterium]|nr:thioredoxin [Oscillospiraceae bacterium]